MRNKFTSAVTAAVLVLGGMLVIEGGAVAERAEQADSGLPLEELRVFAEVFGRVKND